MNEVEALKKEIRMLEGKRDRAAGTAAGWTALPLLNCKIADLKLALPIREPEGKKENG